MSKKRNSANPASSQARMTCAGRVPIFFAIVASLFPLGVGSDTALLRVMGPGVVWVAALIGIPHLLQDDGRFVTWFVYNIKGCDDQTAAEIFTPVDQSMHVLALFGLALVAAA